MVDMSVLDGLDIPRPDRGHRMETWEQARARITALPEPERAQRLAELEALEKQADALPPQDPG